MSDAKRVPSLDGYPKKLLRFANPLDKMWSGFNPSIAISSDGQIAMTVRSSNYLMGERQSYTSLTVEADIRNRLWFAELNSELSITDMYELDVIGELSFKRGVEDARLFWRDGQWWMTGVILERPHTLVARVGLFSIDLDARTAELVEKYEGASEKLVEKNWGVISGEASSSFDYIYGPNAIIKNKEIKHFGVAEKLEKIRGGSQLIPWDDGYLAVCHITRIIGKPIFNPMTFSIQGSKLRDYTHLFVKYNASGEIEMVSDEFIFKFGGVEFACGLVQIDDQIVITYGYNDVESWLTKVSVKDINLMLHPA